jgi:hypothetical protein
MSRCLLLALLLLLRCLPAGAADRALLIGISQYAELEGLRYADADVKTFSQILVDFGGHSRSDVTVVLNTEATKERITAEVERIVRESKSTPLDTFIFMFAGHGMPSRMEVGRLGSTAAQRTNIFLAPFDASTAPEAFYSTGDEIVNETFINRAWLAKQLGEIKAKSIIIIVDSCYSGTEAFGDLYFEIWVTRSAPSTTAARGPASGNTGGAATLSSVRCQSRMYSKGSRISLLVAGISFPSNTKSSGTARSAIVYSRPSSAPGSQCTTTKGAISRSTIYTPASRRSSGKRK